LLDRADAANILQADVFLSIHNNSVPTDMPDAARKLYRGTTALYNAAAPKPAKELAKLLADELSSTLRIHKYPLQDRPNLVVLNSTWVPAVIAEVAMMPHPQDAKMLSQRVYRQQAAQAIFQAVEKYFSLMPLEYRREF
jgi:N-acetylmuramoyl-L-alanine amidase